MNTASEWETRYQTNDMPWEKGEPSPGLVDFLQAHPDLQRGTVAVPGCGTGHDVLAWAQAGFAAAGYDIAESAVRLGRERTAQAGLNAEFVLGDFLAGVGRKFDWIFEHTFFCAINPSQRDDYVNAMVNSLKPGGQLLAVHYMINDTDGPPFGTTQSEIWQRFSPHFDLVHGWIPRSYPNRVGLELMFWWKRKP